MSILIRNMAMPKNCGDCVCELLHYRWCGAKQKPIDDLENRPSWCPLIELPPHGRLIDADAFTALMFADPYQDFVHIIEQMPTIIPASEE